MFTISSPSSDRNLLTQAETRAAIGDVGTISAAKIDTLRARVSAVINRVCNVAATGATPPTLRLETISETFRLKTTRDVLVLARRPVTAITSLVESGTTLAASSYEIESSSGCLYKLSGDEHICWSVGKIVVVYSAGWETVPDDLKEAAHKLAAVLWSEGERVDPNLKRENIPGLGEMEYWVSPSDDPLIPAEVMDLLAPYRNHWVG